MKLGLRLPQRDGVDLQHDVVAAARTAEAAGYESLWAWERLLYPVNPLDPFAPWLPSYRQVAAPLTVLAAAAGMTGCGNAEPSLGGAVQVRGPLLMDDVPPPQQQVLKQQQRCCCGALKDLRPVPVWAVQRRQTGCPARQRICFVQSCRVTSGCVANRSVSSVPSGAGSART